MKLTMLALSILSFTVLAEPKIQGNPDELTVLLNGVHKTVSITATASKRLTSNKALIKILVQTQAPALANALEKNAKVRARVREKLQKSGIELNNIRESKFSSTPEYGWFGDEPKSYKVENIISIIVISEGQMIKTAAIVDKEKLIHYLSSKSEYDEMAEIEAGLLKRALQTASNKAKLYQKILQVILTPVSVVESTINATVPEPALGRRSKLASYEVDVPRVNFGETKFTQSVTVTYRLVAQ